MIDKVSSAIAKLTQKHPAFFHFDVNGFLRLANGDQPILRAVHDMFNRAEEKGGNVYVPVFSYSFTKKETFSVKDTPSTLGRVSDFLRKNNFEKRTTDALFSYLSFSASTDGRFFEPLDFESFGPKSLMASVFERDGYFLSVGDRLHETTPVHFLEKLLNVEYRIDKDFQGQIVSLDNVKQDQVIRFFCRDLEFAKKYNARVSFKRLFDDMRSENRIETINVDGEVAIEAVKFQSVLSFLRKKLPQDMFYLMVDETTRMPVNA